MSLLNDKKPSEYIREFASIQGTSIRSRQVQAVCDFLDAQHKSLLSTLDLMEEKIKALKEKS